MSLPHHRAEVFKPSFSIVSLFNLIEGRIASIVVDWFHTVGLISRGASSFFFLKQQQNYVQSVFLIFEWQEELFWSFTPNAWSSLCWVSESPNSAKGAAAGIIAFINIGALSINGNPPDLVQMLDFSHSPKHTMNDSKPGMIRQCQHMQY